MTQQLLDPPTTATGSTRWVWPIRGLAAAVGVTVLVFGSLSVIGFFMLRTDTQTQFFSTPVRAVQVSASYGNVLIRTGSTQRGATVVSRSHSSFRTARHTERVTDGVLKVRGFCTGRLFVTDQCSVDLEITVGPGTTVSASTSTGTISVLGTRGPVTARSNTGDLRVSQASGSVQLTTDVGDVTADLLNSAQVRARSHTGDIRLSFTRPPRQVQAVSDVGDVRVLVPDDTTGYRVSAEVNLGDRHVDVPTDPSSSRVVEVSTNTGDVRVGLLTR